MQGDAAAGSSGDAAKADAPSSAEKGGSRSAAAAEERHEPAEWDDECFYCGKEGKLTCCDVCPRVFHLRCLPAADRALLQSSADQEWWCPRCRRVSRVAFCLSRELAHPALAESDAESDVARRLYAFMADGQHTAHWEPLRDAGQALLHAMAQTPPWQSRRVASGDPRADAARAADAPAQLAADLLATRVAPEWWAGAFTEPEAPDGSEGSPRVAAGGAAPPRKKARTAA